MEILDILCLFKIRYEKIIDNIVNIKSSADEKIKELKAELLQKLNDEKILHDLFFYFRSACEDRFFETHNALINLSIQLGMKIQQTIDENEQN